MCLKKKEIYNFKKKYTFSFVQTNFEKIFCVISSSILTGVEEGFFFACSSFVKKDENCLFKETKS